MIRGRRGETRGKYKEKGERNENKIRRKEWKERRRG